jgi:hypothetical protein
MEINETWYECYAIADYYRFLLFNTLESIIPTSRLLEIVKWNDDDAITRPLRMRIAYLPKPKLT